VRSIAKASTSSETAKNRVLHSPIRTCGEAFPDGAIIELVAKGARLALFVFDGQHRTIVRQARFRGHLFRPAKLNLSIQRAVRFPERCADFGSTTHLFGSTQKLFARYGFPEEVGLAATYFSFATWFVEASPVAPCLLITGPRLEALLLLELLGCLVRHPLPLAEFTRHALCSLPMNLQPTLLVNGKLGGAELELLRSSSYRNAFVVFKNRLINIFSAKAMFFGGNADGSVLGASALHVDLSPSGGCALPILEEKVCRELTREFQSKFLAYRCDHFLEVLGSRFDLPEFTSATRVLARILGAPIVDAPVLQAGLKRMLQDCEHEQSESLGTDLRRVVLEAVLHHCHVDCGRRVQVGEFTRTVNGILQGRGSVAKREAREVGPVLRSLGLIAKRNSAGLAILLDTAVSRRIHRLAAGFGLLVRPRGERCQLCQSLVHQENARNGSASEGENKWG
jgi:hypothetical protein